MSEPGTKQQAAIRLRAGATEVVFLREHDRWRHDVALGNGSRLESVEGPAAPACDPRWPASPVFTEVSRVDIAGRPAILGVGLAGRSHFSASVTIHPTLPDSLLFEIACRLHEPPGPLGSTYTQEDGSTVRAEPADAPATDPGLPRTVEWRYTIGPAGLQPQPRQP